jgi:hypothetical protein
VGVEVQLYSFFNLGARRGWVISATLQPPYSLKRLGTYCMGGWVDPRAGLDGCKNLVPTGIPSPDVQPIA